MKSLDSCNDVWQIAKSLFRGAIEAYIRSFCTQKPLAFNNIGFFLILDAYRVNMANVQEHRTIAHSST